MKRKLKRWQKTCIAYVSFFLILAIVAGSFILLSVNPDVQYGLTSGIISHSKAGENITDAILKSDAPTTVLENESLSLALTNNGNIKVTDKSTGKIWSSEINEQDQSLFDYGYAESHSLFTITYLNAKNAEARWTSYEQCVQKKQLHIYKKSDDTIRMDFILGESSTDQLIPTAIVKERFENEILPLLEESEQEFLKRQYVLYVADELTAEDNPTKLFETYPNLKKTPIYIVKNISAKITKEKLTKVFEKIKYSNADYERDNKLTGYTANKSTLTYKVVLDFKLSGNDLIVTVPKDELVFYRKYPLLKIALMDFFINATDEASVLIPSGSGAIAKFVPGNSALTYKGMVYDADYNKTDRMLPQVMQESSKLSLPMYAVRNGLNTVTTCIESGAANAQLVYEAGKQGMRCYYDFTVLQHDKAYVNIKTSINQPANQITNEDITVRYTFAENEIADSDEAVFSNVASQYREYLENKGVLSKDKNKALENPTVLLDILGNITVKQDLLGLFPVNKSLILSDFDTSKEMVNYFLDSDISNLSVKLSGWNSGGLYRQAAGKFNINSSIGGKKAKTVFEAFLNDNNIPLTYYAEHTAFLNPSSFDGYKTSYTATQVDGNSAIIKGYSAVEGSNFGKGSLALISPSKYVEISKKYINSNLSRISVGNLANTLVSDYSSDFFDRTRTKNAVISALDNYKKEDIYVSVDDANEYAFGYVNFIENMPLASGESSAFAQSFPLKQMVLHGYIDYTSEVDFSTEEAKYNALKAISSGSGLKAILTYKDSEYKFGSYYSNIYSTSYNATKTSIAENGKMVAEALKGLGNEKIVAYSSNGEVSKTTYSNGTVIYVNTTNENVVFDNNEIMAMSYLRVN